MSVEGGFRLEWRITLAVTPRTRLLNAVSRLAPGSLWRLPAVLRLMGKAAGLTLRAGRVSLVGQVPNGHRFIANPRLVWIISDCAATLNGTDLGTVAPLAAQERLGDFWIPQRGIFALAQAFLEPFDPLRHVSATTQAIPADF